MAFAFTEEKLSNRVLLIKVDGGMDGGSDSPQERAFYDRLITCYGQGIKNVIIDFNKLLYFNDTAPNLLLKIVGCFQEGGGDIKLVGLPWKVRDIFNMLGIDGLLSIYETIDDALASVTM